MKCDEVKMSIKCMYYIVIKVEGELRTAVDTGDVACSLLPYVPR